MQNKGKFFLCFVCVLLGIVAGGFGGFLAAKGFLQDINIQVTDPSDIQMPTGTDDLVAQNNQIPTIVSIAERCKKVVVSIEVETVVKGYTGGSAYSKTETSCGTGVVIREDGYIATCHHVVEDADKITVIMDDKTEYIAECVGFDKSFDLAVIRVEGVSLETAALGNSTKLRAGEGVVVIGNPLGEFGSSVSAGVLSATEREVTIEGEPLRLLQTDAAINPGNSGGGMFNMQGQLIGIVNAKMFATGIEGLGFAIPLDTVQKKIDSIISEGNTGDKAVLGVVTQASVCYINNQKVDCVKITTVKENSAAEMAGLAVGDFLLSADGKPIRNNDDLVLIIKYSKPGDTLGFEVYRDNKAITVETTLGSSN